MSRSVLDRMDDPATPKITQGNLVILTGLVTAEWWKIRQDPGRKPYYETLTKLRYALIDADRLG